MKLKALNSYEVFSYLPLNGMARRFCPR